jgi:sulfate adenylyltransferase
LRTPIAPHGSTLVNRLVEADRAEALIDEAQRFPQVTLSARQLSDVEMIGTGAFSPLEGFMTRDDYESVVCTMRLSSGLPWTLPVTLSATDERVRALDVGDRITLRTPEGHTLGVMDLEDIYRYDKRAEAQLVYRTTDPAHPGVAALYDQGDWLLGGKITLACLPEHRDFREYRLTPAETRRIFEERGWRRIVGFQTRNPVHRAHEYLHKCVMETYDALFLHPVIGPTKAGDLPNDMRMRCYETLIENYYPQDRVLLAAYPAWMRYAGPREAVFHAIVRKNYGCTHFIVGRDHAGVGAYYHTYDAHRIFEEFTEEELGITPLFFDHAFYCKRCEGIASTRTCPHGENDRLHFSGTRVRQMLQAGKTLPREFTRPEVAQVMIEWAETARKTLAARST